jgi:hypothetical protein
MPLARPVHLLKEHGSDFANDIELVPDSSPPAALFAQQPELLIGWCDENPTCLAITHHRTQLKGFHGKVLDEASAHSIVALYMSTNEVPHLGNGMRPACHTTASRLKVVGNLLGLVSHKVWNEAELEKLLAW